MDGRQGWKADIEVFGSCCLFALMDFDIEPRVGIKGLRLGSAKDAVRQFFESEPKVFRRSPTDNPADYWADLGTFAYYDGEAKLEALEFASPAEAKLDGNSLSAMSIEQALIYLQSLDPNVAIEEAGTTLCSRHLGVSVWRATRESNANVEAVLVFGDRYYD